MTFWNRKNKEKRITPSAVEQKTAKHDDVQVAKNSAQDKTGRAASVLVHPLMTEKGTALESNSKYLFNVYKHSTKPEIRKAVKQLYGVEVADVNVLNVRGKKVRFGKSHGFEKNWKKAIVTLKPGQKIEIYKK